MNPAFFPRPAVGLLCFLGGITLAPVVGLAQPATNTPAAAPAGGKPQIQFAKLVHDFERIMGGESVRHDFYFTNTGTASLRIISVNATCGCTTAAEWTREVAPGGVGVIPLKFNSGNFSGAVTKTASVGTTDPDKPLVTLQIKATVWRPVEIAPSVVMLNVNSELVSNATAVVRITNHASEPLEVFEPISSNPQFAAELRTNAPGKLFEVVVRSVPPLNIANPHGQITVKTSSTNTPTLSVTAMCVVQPSIGINPPRAVIHEAQLTNEVTMKISLRNGMNRPMQLSDAVVNVPGARVTLREVEVARAYEATLVLPAGARDGNAPAEITIKSNFPDYDLVRIPILFVNSANAVNAQGVPLTSRASRFLATPEGRRILDGRQNHDDHGTDDPTPPAAPK
jgi:hypothetical protein